MFNRFFGRLFLKRFALCYQTVVLSCPVLSCLSVLSVTLVYCGQTVGWIKMKLGMQVGLGLTTLCYMGSFGDTATPPQIGTTPQFSAHICCGQMAGGIKCHLVGGRPRPKRHCVIWGPSSPPQKGAELHPEIFGPCLLWPNSWMDQDGIWHVGRPQPRPHCARCGPIPPAQKGA